MRLHAALARALASHGVRTMFGLTGAGNKDLVHSFAAGGGEFVAAAHEAGAMSMGFGYASVTGLLGVVTVTHGPALTNTLTGLVEGVRGRIPMLLIAGDTATISRGNVQDIPQRDVVLPTGAGFEPARTPETTLADLAVAIRQALTERRPVVFDVPRDFAWREVKYWDVPLNLRPPRRIIPDPSDVRLAAREIASAQRPIVVAGQGAIEARSSLLRLAERIGAPVATTLKAKDLFRGEEFDLEIVGGLAGPVSRAIFDSADVIISIGAGLDACGLRRSGLLDRQRLILVDAEDDVAPQADLTVWGDAVAVTDALVSALDMMSAPPSGFRNPAMAVRLAEQARMGDRPLSGMVDLATALRRLDEILPRRRVLVDDGGPFIAETFRHLHPGDPRAYVLPLNFGSTGMGMGAAVGAAVARHGEPVIMVCHDGGFVRGGLAEFTTAARYGLDIIVIVCNDGGNPEFARLAEALGGEGFTVRGPDDLDRAADVLANRTRPLLIDLRLDANQARR